MSMYDKRSEIRCFWCNKLLEIIETIGDKVTITTVGTCFCPGSEFGANKVVAKE